LLLQLALLAYDLAAWVLRPFSASQRQFLELRPLLLLALLVHALWLASWNRRPHSAILNQLLELELLLLLVLLAYALAAWGLRPKCASQG